MKNLLSAFFVIFTATLANAEPFASIEISKCSFADRDHFDNGCIRQTINDKRFEIGFFDFQKGSETRDRYILKIENEEDRFITFSPNQTYGFSRTLFFIDDTTLAVYEDSLLTFYKTEPLSSFKPGETVISLGYDRLISTFSLVDSEGRLKKLSDRKEFLKHFAVSKNGLFFALNGSFEPATAISINPRIDKNWAHQSYVKKTLLENASATRLKESSMCSYNFKRKKKITQCLNKTEAQYTESVRKIKAGEIQTYGDFTAFDSDYLGAARPSHHITCTVSDDFSFISSFDLRITDKEGKTSYLKLEADNPYVGYMK